MVRRRQRVRLRRQRGRRQRRVRPYLDPGSRRHFASRRRSAGHHESGRHAQRSRGYFALALGVPAPADDDRAGGRTLFATSTDRLFAVPIEPSSDIRRLIEIMAALRDPVAGCPWDVEQTFASIAPFTIEEAYEVADAIDRGATEDLREELGDLLLQVVFHARMAEEAGLFDFGGVVEAITTKLVRRHPHVFGDASARNPAAVKELWGRIKAEEKRAKSESRAGRGLAADDRSGALDGVPLALPGLTRAMKLQEKAGKVGFDWNDVRAVLEKIREEVVEVEAEIGAGSAQSLSDEVGDLLFAAVNL